MTIFADDFRHAQTRMKAIAGEGNFRPVPREREVTYHEQKRIADSVVASLNIGERVFEALVNPFADFGGIQLSGVA
jgi:hypothetical protein